MTYNRVKTIKKVSDFFGDPNAINTPSDFKDLLDLAHITNVDSLYHSPVISDMPTNRSIENRMEESTINHLFGGQPAKDELATIGIALHNMEYRFGHIIYLRHFKFMSIEDIAETVDYSSSNVRKLLDTAYYKFALWTEEYLKLTVSVAVE
ncbi:hypothetical protein [Leuconostoc gelidum]|uniref:Sigma-70 family RNA polymerase sigma factor n=1 Tax=Leuconostoc gelidum subsp. gelidum TaxID=1607839 RepID=A0AB35FXQ9_LEUGE|nr:hypothetical protein [Leuconostoc gelidum]MBZ6015416.1 hypothetical protein [Leuconostoc gelidum subsp. gelidum]